VALSSGRLPVTLHCSPTDNNQCSAHWLTDDGTTGCHSGGGRRIRGRWFSGGIQHSWSASEYVVSDLPVAFSSLVLIVSLVFRPNHRSPIRQSGGITCGSRSLAPFPMCYHATKGLGCSLVPDPASCPSRLCFSIT
jgi:hypothetical protein